MPDRFLSYHNAHASVFEYLPQPRAQDGPGRTVYTDPRLEVAGAELFERVPELGKQIAEDKPGWEAELDRIGRPSIMVDHQDNARIGASLLASRHWKCVWFDPIVAVFVHDSYREIVENEHGRLRRAPFPARSRDRASRPAALLAAAKGLRNYVNFSIDRATLAGRSSGWALNYARRIVETDPDSAEGWKTSGRSRSCANRCTSPARGSGCPSTRSSTFRWCGPTYAFRRALEHCSARLHDRAGLATGLTRRGRCTRPSCRCSIAWSSSRRSTPFSGRMSPRPRPRPTALRRRLGEPSALGLEEPGRARSDRDRAACPGRAATAAEILGAAYPAEKAPWDDPRPDGDLAPASGRAREGAGPLAAGLRGPQSGGPRRTASRPRSWPRSSSRRPEGPMSRPSRPARPLRGAVRPGGPRAGRRPRLGRLRAGTRARSSRLPATSPALGPRHRFGRRPDTHAGKAAGWSP